MLCCVVRQARLQSKASELQGLSGREEELKERLNDLNAFVEVRSGRATHILTGTCMRNATQWHCVATRTPRLGPTHMWPLRHALGDDSPS